MSIFKPNVSIDVLPDDALILKDDEFYSLVENLTSSETAQVLRIQRINSINTFLLCKNIPASILLPTSSFEILRRNTCVKLDQNNNDCYVVHVGIVGQLEYLCEVFKKKQLHNAKHPTATTRSQITFNDASSKAICPSSNRKNMTNNGNSLSFDPRAKMITSINKWIVLQKKMKNEKYLNLVEGIDYSTQFPSPDTVIFDCKCQTRVSIPISSDGSYSLSNLYKHWKTGKRCDVFKPILSSRPSSDEDSCSSSSEDSSTTSEQEREHNDEDDENENIHIQLAPFSTPIIQTTTTSNKKKRTSSSVTTADWSLRKRRR